MPGHSSVVAHLVGSLGYGHTCKSRTLSVFDCAASWFSCPSLTRCREGWFRVEPWLVNGLRLCQVQEKLLSTTQGDSKMYSGFTE